MKVSRQGLLECMNSTYQLGYTIWFARLLIECSIVESERQYNPGDGINRRYNLAFYYYQLGYMHNNNVMYAKKLN